MDFLMNTIVSEKDNSIFGLALTHFDPKDFRSRATVKLYSTEEILSNRGLLKPAGFELHDDGTILSDSIIRSSVADSMFSYIESEMGSRKHQLDIIDLVLFGVKQGCTVFVNYEKWSEDKENVEPVLIKMKDFRVSNSSFNIYAPYRNEDDEFRTCSLLESTNGSVVPIYIAIPKEVDVSEFGDQLKFCDELLYSTSELFVYSYNVGLLPYEVGVGEAFLNYLAYNVAYYTIGEKVMKVLMPKDSSISNMDIIKKKPAKPPKRPEANVSIEHDFRYEKVKEVLAVYQDSEKLRELCEEDAEAKITVDWIAKVLNSPWFMQTTNLSENERLATSCINVIQECRLRCLKFALELLAHRYYIYSIGYTNDTLNFVLSGGGVLGSSIKRFNI